MQVALGHGVLRWSDPQHSKDLTLTDDAIMGITWKMKKRSVQVPWARSTDWRIWSRLGVEVA